MDVIEFAETRKRAAQRRRKEREFDRALLLMDEAIQALERERGTLSATALGGERGRRLAEALGDAHGTKGGILRTAGRYDESCDAYDEGYKYEGDERYRFVNSYNLTQRLVARFLALPGRFEQESWKHKDVEYPGSFEQAEQTIRDQMAGPRLNDPWAMADRALILLLLVRDESEEQAAWRRIESAAPPAYVFSSTLDVVNDLSGRVQEKLSDSLSPRVAAVRARLDGAGRLLGSHSS